MVIEILPIINTQTLLLFCGCVVSSCIHLPQFLHTKQVTFVCSLTLSGYSGTFPHSLQLLCMVHTSPLFRSFFTLHGNGGHSLAAVLYITTEEGISIQFRILASCMVAIHN